MSGWERDASGCASIKAGPFSGSVFRKQFTEGWYAGWGTPGVTLESVTRPTAEEAERWVVDQIRQAAAETLCALPPVEREWSIYGDARHCVGRGALVDLIRGPESERLTMGMGVADLDDGEALASLLLSMVEAWRATRETASTHVEKEEGGSQRARADAMLRGRWSEIVRALAAGPEDG